MFGLFGKRKPKRVDIKIRVDREPTKSKKEQLKAAETLLQTLLSEARFTCKEYNKKSNSISIEVVRNEDDPIWTRNRIEIQVEMDYDQNDRSYISDIFVFTDCVFEREDGESETSLGLDYCKPKNAEARIKNYLAKLEEEMRRH